MVKKIQVRFKVGATQDINLKQVLQNAADDDDDLDIVDTFDGVFNLSDR